MLGFAMLVLLSPLLALGVWRYLIGTFRLRGRVEAEAPELFARLGRPQQVYRNTGLPGMNAITPLGPWIAWIRNPDRFGGVPPALRRDHARQRWLQCACLVGFVLWILAFVIAGPPS